MLILRVGRLVWEILPTPERRRLALLLGALTMVALGQVSGIVSWYPFVKVLVDRGAVAETPWLRSAFVTLGFESARTFLLALGVLVGFTVVLSTGLRILADWLACRFSWSTRALLADRLLRRYMHLPHLRLLEQSSAERVRDVMEGVPLVVEGCVLGLCRIYTSSVLSLVVVAGLVALDPVVALASAGIVGAIFGGVYRMAEGRARGLARAREEEAHAMARCVAEALASVKEARCPPSRGDPAAAFRRHQARFNELEESHELQKNLPAPLTRGSVQVGILLVGLYLMRTDLQEFQALLAVYAVALIRIAPDLGAVYKGMTSLRHHVPALERLHPHLGPLAPEAGPRPEPLPLREGLRLEEVHFSYTPGGPEVVRALGLEVPCRGALALVGPTGAGKTTVADLLAGVLVPDRGRVLLDGEPLDDDRRARWRMSVGYVPQQIYLTDDTLRRNIAFGVPPEEIDEGALRAASREAALDELVVDLPEGLETMVGERGVALSGGQRQRVGIARALYRRPEVLVLDEATSALDTVTERSIMDTLSGLAAERTVVVIAHRLSTVVGCDQICFLQDGELVARGTYQEVLESCAAFRAMVAVAHQDALPDGGAAPGASA